MSTQARRACPNGCAYRALSVSATTDQPRPLTASLLLPTFDTHLLAHFLCSLRFGRIVSVPEVRLYYSITLLVSR